MISILRTALCLGSLLALNGCWWSGAYETPASQYIQRTQTITTSAGNDQSVNAATQVIDPWLPGAGDPRIPGNGDRSVSAMQRYRTFTPGSGGPAGQSGQASQIGQSGVTSPSSATTTSPVTLVPAPSSPLN